jgi:DNA-binding MarR family transcriptional regulator
MSRGGGATSVETPPQLSAHEQLGRSFKGAVAAVRRLQGRQTHRSSGAGLSHAQYGLLFGLQPHERLPSSELAYVANLSPAAATEMLDALVAAGLVRRERSERDRRVVLISLTDRGRERVAERRAKYEPRWRAALADFSEDELRSAAAVLDQLSVYFEELKDV